jgi:hypothetical protein
MGTDCLFQVSALIVFNHCVNVSRHSLIPFSTRLKPVLSHLILTYPNISYSILPAVSRGISKAADMGAACAELRDEMNACRTSFLHTVESGDISRPFLLCARLSVCLLNWVLRQFNCPLKHDTCN